MISKRYFPNYFGRLLFLCSFLLLSVSAFSRTHAQAYEVISSKVIISPSNNRDYLRPHMIECPGEYNGNKIWLIAVSGQTTHNGPLNDREIMLHFSNDEGLTWGDKNQQTMALPGPGMVMHPLMIKSSACSGCPTASGAV